jgi:hypothetical protein
MSEPAYFLTLLFGSIVFIVIAIGTYAYRKYTHEINQGKLKLEHFLTPKGYKIKDLKKEKYLKKSTFEEYKKIYEDFPYLFSKDNELIDPHAIAENKVFLNDVKVTLTHRRVHRRSGGNTILEALVDIQYPLQKHFPDIAFYKDAYAFPGLIQMAANPDPLDMFNNINKSDDNIDSLLESSELLTKISTMTDEFYEMYPVDSDEDYEQTEHFKKDLDALNNKTEKIYKQIDALNIERESIKSEQEEVSNLSIMTQDVDIMESLKTWYKNGTLKLIEDLDFGMMQIKPNRLCAVIPFERDLQSFDEQLDSILKIVHDLSK